MGSVLKAGLIGGAAMVILNLVSLIPFMGCVVLIIEPVLYVGVGALAAYWMPSGRLPGAAAGQGALAALLASLISGVVRTALMVIQMAMVGSAVLLSQIPPESLQQLRDAGIDPDIFVGPAAGAIYGSVCCGLGLVLAAGLGALGGVIYASARPE